MTRNFRMKGIPSPMVWWLLVFGIMLGITVGANAQTLTAVAYTVAPASAQPINASIVLKATATGGENVQYQFEKGVFADEDAETETWTTLQAFSATSSYTWKPATAGFYTIRVLAREGTSGPGTVKAEATYIITPTPPSAVTLTGNPAAPQPLNTKVTLTGAATGGTNVQYKFENGTQVLQNWSSDNTVDWTANAAASYSLKVSAREAFLPNTVVTKTLNYKVTAALSAVALAVSPAAPQAMNKPVTLTATPTGGANIQYKFEVGTGTDNVTWVTKQDFRASNTYTWTPSAGGDYSVRVTAREGTVDATAKVSQIVKYLVTTTPPTAVTLTADPASAQPVNTEITLTAAATGAGAGSVPEYQFEVGTTKLQEFGTTATCKWTPDKSGAYVLKVSAREKGLNAVVVTKTINYTITAALSAAALAVSPAAPQTINKAITLTASSTGGANVRYKFEVGTGTDTVTWVTKQDYNAAKTYTWTPTTADTYSLRVTAREGTIDATAKASAIAKYLITTTPPTAVTLTASPASAQPVNTEITLTGAATGGGSGSTYEYQFEVGTTKLQEFSTTATYKWTPNTAGAYVLKVSARQKGYNATVVTKTINFTVTPALSAATLAVSPAAPQTINKAITLAGSATGGANIQYKFEVGTGTDTVTWVTKQDYNAAKTYTWTPTTADTYSLRVTAREGTIDATAKASAIAKYLITTTPPTAVTLTADPASAQPVNTEITLTGAATGGGSGSTYEYQFEVGTTKLQEFSNTATYKWTPGTAGAYVLKVSARQKGYNATVVTKTINFTVTPALSAAAFAVSPVAPQAINKAITLTASATGGANVQFKFEVGTGTDTVTWETKQQFGSAKTYTWTPTAADSYSLRVTAREGTADSTAKASAIATYLVTPTPPTAVNLTASPASAQPVNTKVTLTGAATGGSTGCAYEYKFEVGTTKLQDFSSTATCDWTPDTAGSYTLKVSARQKDLGATVVTKSITYTITAALSAVTLASSPAAPQAINKAITLTATATGGANVQYKFEVGTGTDTVTWTTKQDYGSAKTCSWTPATPDTYSLRVTAREGTTDSTAKSSAVATYKITPAAPTAVTLTPDLASPRPVKTEILLTAKATGGTDVEYRFESSGTALQDWGSAATYKWTPTTAGSYTLKVLAREKGLEATTVNKTLTYTVQEESQLKSVSVSANPAAPKPANTAITLTATATGNSLQYKYEVGIDNGTSIAYTTKRDWNTTATYAWTPTAANKYFVKVSAREGTTGTPVTTISTYIVNGDMVVTGVFEGYFYAQNVTGTYAWGTKVESEDEAAVGDKVTAIAGTCDETTGGEVYIDATSVTKNSTATVPDPITMPTPQDVAAAPVTQIGVLVKTHGTVSSVGNGSMVIDDGDGGDPLTVIGDFGSVSATDVIDVTGIITLDADGTPTLLVRTADDVTIKS